MERRVGWRRSSTRWAGNEVEMEVVTEEISRWSPSRCQGSHREDIEVAKEKSSMQLQGKVYCIRGIDIETVTESMSRQTER